MWGLCNAIVTPNMGIAHEGNLSEAQPHAIWLQIVRIPIVGYWHGILTKN